MITTAIAMLIAVQGPQASSNSSGKAKANELISNMFDHYANAKALAGTIKMTQSAKGATVTTDTEVQYDRPAKLYIHQTQSGSKGRQWLLDGDGTEFSYDNPSVEFGRARNVEYVTQHGVSLKISDQYEAAQLSLGDRNAILDSAISLIPRLKLLTVQWTNLADAGKVKLDDQEVNKITGDFREDSQKPVTGHFEIYINDQGDFVRYALQRNYMLPQVSKDPIVVTTIWDAELKVDGKTDPSLYRVVQ